MQRTKEILLLAVQQTQFSIDFNHQIHWGLVLDRPQSRRGKPSASNLSSLFIVLASFLHHQHHHHYQQSTSSPTTPSASPTTPSSSSPTWKASVGDCTHLVHLVDGKLWIARQLSDLGLDWNLRICQFWISTFSCIQYQIAISIFVLSILWRRVFLISKWVLTFDFEQGLPGCIIFVLSILGNSFPIRILNI